MKIQRWADKYPSETAPDQDDEGWGVVLETSIGTVRLIEKDGWLEINSPSGALAIRLMSANTFAVFVDQRIQ